MYGRSVESMAESVDVACTGGLLNLWLNVWTCIIHGRYVQSTDMYNFCFVGLYKHSVQSTDMYNFCFVGLYNRSVQSTDMYNFCFVGLYKRSVEFMDVYYIWTFCLIYGRSILP